MEDPKKIILKTEYSNKFDEIRKDLVVQSYFKYGKASRNFVSGYVDAIGSLKKCIRKFEETGNLEYLADAANYCMFRYMYQFCLALLIRSNLQKVLLQSQSLA